MSINYDEKKINKSNFYKNKKLFHIYDLDRYNDDDLIRPLCIKLPQMVGYVKHFDSNKKMSFKNSDNKLLKKYNEICENVSRLLNIKFDSEPVYGDNDKYIKTKIKSYGDKVNTYFQGKKKYQKKVHHISVYH